MNNVDEFLRSLREAGIPEHELARARHELTAPSPPTGNAPPPIVDDPVSAPAHYRTHPSGIECVQITEHMDFLLGNVIKYVWRADLKDDAVQDLEKARWYLDRAITNRKDTDG